MGLEVAKLTQLTKHVQSSVVLMSRSGCVFDSGSEHELHPAAEEDVGQGEHGEVRDPRAPDEPVQQLRQLPLIAEGGAVTQRGRHRGPREGESPPARSSLKAALWRSEGAIEDREKVSHRPPARR